MIEKEFNLNHLAIIMDGNGRWATDQNLDRVAGHRKGAQSAKKIIEACANLNIPYLTLYAFSKENWNRPIFEVESLMSLLGAMLTNELEELTRNNIVFQIVGRIEDLPKGIQEIVINAIELSLIHI